MPPDRLKLTRHADHDPSLVCRPALGYGLCEVLEEQAATEAGVTEARRLVADAEAADTVYRLAAVKVVVYEFLHQYGHSELPTFQVALDLAVSLRKIVEGRDDDEVVPEFGHLSASDRALVAWITGGGIRSREIRVELDEEDGA